jgi:HSP20 family molecular chaperone IbpA
MWLVFSTTPFPRVRKPSVLLIRSRAASLRSELQAFPLLQGTDNAVCCRVDVHEGPDNTIVASFELPGLKKEDVNIELHNNRLTVSGESKHSEERTEAGYAVRERRFGKFSRSVPLPEGTKVSALLG